MVTVPSLLAGIIAFLLKWRFEINCLLVPLNLLVFYNFESY